MGLGLVCCVSWLDCRVGFLGSCCNASFGLGDLLRCGLVCGDVCFRCLGGLVAASGFWFLATCWFSDFCLLVCGCGCLGVVVVGRGFGWVGVLFSVGLCDIEFADFLGVWVLLVCWWYGLLVGVP